MIILRRVFLALVLVYNYSSGSYAQISAHITSTAVTVGATSIVVSQAKTRGYLGLSNQSPTATIYCTLDGTAAVAVATAKQITLFPNGSFIWEAGVIPNNPFNCIASAGGTPLTVLE